MTILAISLLTLVASIIGTVSGFGISTIMVPIVLLFLPLPETLLLVGVIHWFGDLWKILLFKHGIDKKILIYFGIPGMIGAGVGAALVVNIPEIIASQIVGVILITYVLYLLIKPNFRIEPNPKVAGVGGGLSGLLGGLTGVGGGALRAVVLTAFNIPKSTYIFTSGVLGALIDASRISIYLISGTKIPQLLFFGLFLFIPASFLGAEIAKKLVGKIPQKTFRNLIALFLFLLGVKLLFFP
ncbi:hypothetical protein A3A76_05340 [Candidatus Woesebacteria bacterium RIFCSPLOWO2_01_FULL_39_23]|uniref:Probable membrane transporter protein n=2 Tax=Microgenomates group TaxID=1794810 RepID=A0A0H4T3V2_9BACT|nr:hypothetical protein [uncultured Microgenomates bacterium Rifle_16ft_4_minimus_37633]OGM13904.1 MAG: hypothetical protein A2141_04565 [Candidatus Woesebacteria bacterium RBG_16_40_11]OGM27856.1 MAG: hypothetical protein A2628_05560 [Candidatus Woesebacteria bacterium RIFCSPHIGHO2_01_FULL_40_22]OGM36318.1 MAG: hypothetical protein A3E41_02755 [Candidatus Woesebacteria bacterium RIFCSPHIGHO2_12_FULL_38_9]OGM62278.1 MAG: hypothetical protein A3A76_05340 [Candidatus Woesebacteria bacterium RIFCS